MSKYRITVENIPGMGGTLKDAPWTIECDGLFVIGVIDRTENEFRATTGIHGMSSRQIAHVVMEQTPVRQAIMAAEIDRLTREYGDRD